MNAPAVDLPSKHWLLRYSFQGYWIVRWRLKPRAERRAEDLLATLSLCPRREGRSTKT